MIPSLTMRHRKALEHLSRSPNEFFPAGAMPSGLNQITLEQLTKFGLAEEGYSPRYVTTGWRISAAGREYLKAGLQDRLIAEDAISCSSPAQTDAGA